MTKSRSVLQMLSIFSFMSGDSVSYILGMVVVGRQLGDSVSKYCTF